MTAAPFAAHTDTDVAADPYLTYLDLASEYHADGATPRNAGQRAMEAMRANGFDADTVTAWFRRYRFDTL